MSPSNGNRSLKRMPEWNSSNFADHYERHLGDDDCRKVYPPSKSGRPISQDEYRELSKKAVSESWAEATFFDNKNDEHRRFFANGDLVLAITSDGGKRYITCYHKHLENSPFRSDCEMLMERTEDDRKELFERWVEDMRRDERWLEVNWKRRDR